jgi:hypothetical protein
MHAILPPVKQKNIPSALQQQFFKKLSALWPALKGSLAQVRKPCTRPNCRACAIGAKHSAYLLAFTDKGRRRCMYVPNAMAPLLERALRNGRRIEELLYATGPALLREYRTRYPAQTGPAVRVRRSTARKTLRKS